MRFACRFNWLVGLVFCLLWLWRSLWGVCFFWALIVCICGVLGGLCCGFRGGFDFLCVVFGCVIVSVVVIAVCIGIFEGCGFAEDGQCNFGLGFVSLGGGIGTLLMFNSGCCFA